MELTTCSSKHFWKTCKGVPESVSHKITLLSAEPEANRDDSVAKSKAAERIGAEWYVKLLNFVDVTSILKRKI